jgi:hypothetical protein
MQFCYLCDYATEHQQCLKISEPTALVITEKERGKSHLSQRQHTAPNKKSALVILIETLFVARMKHSFPIYDVAEQGCNSYAQSLATICSTALFQKVLPHTSKCNALCDSSLNNN